MMQKQVRRIQWGILFSSVFLIGCAEPLELIDITDPPTQTQLGEEVNTESDLQLEKAIRTANDLNEKVQAGDLNFTGLIDTGKLDDLKDTILEKLEPVMGKLTEVKSKISDLKAQLQAEVDLLDPSVPQQAKIIADVQKAIAKLDQANAQIDNVINKVLGKLDELSAKLDDLINKIDTGNILGVILKVKIRDIKNDEIGSVRDVLWTLLMMS